MCKDTSLSYLNELGYNVIRLPREDIDPLEVIAKKNGHLSKLGLLTNLILAENQAPQVIRDQSVAMITGTRTDNFKIGVGLTLLKRLLSAMGVTAVGLEAAYQQAESIQFEFENVLSDSIDMILVGSYLAHAQIDLSNPILDNINEEGEAFIITETLKSNCFGATAYDQSGTTLDVDVAGIQNVLGVDTQLSVAKDATRRVSFKGQKYLRFAFKVFSIWIRIEGGEAKISLSPPGRLIGPLAASMIRSGEPTPVILGRDTLLRLQ